MELYTTPRQTPPGQTPPASPHQTATASDRMHPTRMHSCITHMFVNKLNVLSATSILFQSNKSYSACNYSQFVSIRIVQKCQLCVFRENLDKVIDSLVSTCVNPITVCVLLCTQTSVTLQNFPAAKHASLTSTVAGCHFGGPLSDSSPIEIGEALTTPTPLSLMGKQHVKKQTEQWSSFIGKHCIFPSHKSDHFFPITWK